MIVLRVYDGRQFLVWNNPSFYKVPSYLEMLTICTKIGFLASIIWSVYWRGWTEAWGVEASI